eukprot:UN03013
MNPQRQFKSATDKFNDFFQTVQAFCNTRFEKFKNDCQDCISNFKNGQYIADNSNNNHGEQKQQQQQHKQSINNNKNDNKNNHKE